MNVEVISTVDAIKSEDIVQKTVIVLDIFRTSSTIITAIAKGCPYIIPAETIGHAKSIKNLSNDFTLAGDRYYKKIAGFTYSNSPMEMSLETEINNPIILTTMDGIRGIIKAFKANLILIGGFLNGDSCVKEALAKKNDIVLLLIGERNNFALEDGLAGGYFIDLIQKYSNPNNIEINDLGLAMYGMYKYYGNQLMDVIKKTTTAKKLACIGLSEDIDFSCQLNHYTVSPYVNSDHIIINKT